MAKKKKKKLKLKKLLLFLIIISLIIYIIYFLLQSPIRNIYVTGNSIISEDEVITLAKLENYPSFFLSFSKKIEKNIKSNPYIKNVKIKKKLGNKIYITIEEYKVICSISDNKIILSSGDKMDNNYNITDIPILINEIDNDVYTNFVNKFSKIDDDILRQISEIEYSKTNVDNERFMLYMDDGNEVYISLPKINKLNKYNDIKSKLDGAKGIIYLDSGNYVELKNIVEVIDEDNTDIDNNIDNNINEDND